ncbi:hypothetical protein [Porphyromonas sp. COT-290 OH3588]|uniref:hypothetical protein n=1 Tax=Porphyromonas sp. COT-290 OH3588 TaxID=1515617 RepID=UPI000AF9553C|nr:hypothetical protein [Porphyromonas sp. COT-290 OH3588]
MKPKVVNKWQFISPAQPTKYRSLKRNQASVLSIDRDIREQRKRPHLLYHTAS